MKVSTALCLGLVLLGALAQVDDVSGTSGDESPISAGESGDFSVFWDRFDGIFGGTGGGGYGLTGMDLPFAGTSGMWEQMFGGKDGMNDFTRDFAWESTTDGLNCIARNNDDDVDDELALEILYGETDDCWMQFKLDYSGSDDDDVNDLDVKFCGVVEFIDSGDNGYDSSDEVVSQYSPPTWESFQELADSDATVHSTSSADGVFTINIYTSSAGSTLTNGADISANEMKFDVLISNFPYNATGTKLAICFSAAGGQGSVEKHGDDETKLEGLSCESSAGISSTFFTWDNYVLANTTTMVTPLVTTYFSSEGRVYFTVDTLEQPSLVYWDPTVGVGSTSADSDAASVANVSILALVLFFVALLL